MPVPDLGRAPAAIGFGIRIRHGPIGHGRGHGPIGHGRGHGRGHGHL